MKLCEKTGWRTCLARALLIAGGLITQVSFAVPIWTATTLPEDGNISGVAGSTIGWGYSIENPDGALWLALTSVSADPFANGTPLAVFDLPILAPGTSSSVAFDGVDGLYGLEWEGVVPVGFVNFGDFLLTAEWYDNDPLAGGSLVETAIDLRLAYSAIVTPQQSEPVPEPSTLVLLVLVGGIAFLQTQQRPSYRWLSTVR